MRKILTFSMLSTSLPLACRSSSSSSSLNELPSRYGCSPIHSVRTAGSWKPYSVLPMTPSLSVLSTSLPPACQRTLLIKAGLETNPGPTSPERQKNKEFVLAGLRENAPDMEPGTKSFKKTAIRDSLRL